MADTRPRRRRQTRILESAGRNEVGKRRRRALPAATGVRGTRRGNMAFAEIEISRGVLPRICQLSRLESCCYSVPVSLSPTLYLSLSFFAHFPRRVSLSPPPHLLLSDRREPRDTNLSFEVLSLSISIPFLSLSFVCIPLHFIAFCLCTPLLSHCLIFSLCDVKRDYSFAKVGRVAKHRHRVTVNNEEGILSV